MSYQNINQYNFRKWYLQPLREIYDISLASDEKDYDQEVVFSPFIIAIDDGNRMPLKFDINSNDTVGCVNCMDFNKDVIVSENYWNPKNLDLLNCGKITNICNVGLTGIDNGLVRSFSGQTIQVNTGLYTNESDKFSRYKYDRRFKMHPIQGFTTPSNRIFQDDSYDYNLFYSVDPVGDVGRFATLKGGFYQGFYQLFGYDYQVLPERYSLGWTTEFLLRYRWTGDTNVGLNARYPDNKGTFFYYGARAENKFYHYANGEPFTDSDANGIWKLYIQDFEGNNIGSLSSATLSLCSSNICVDHHSKEKNILINDDSIASIYPITFEVLNYDSKIEIVNLTLSGYSHTYPGNVGMLLVAPNGDYSIITGRNGSSNSIESINITLTSSSTTIWDGYSEGVFLNNTEAYGDMPFASPCPYQFVEGNITENLSEFTIYSNIRVTHGLNCLKTCECLDETLSGLSSCHHVYQQSGITVTNCNCSCGCDCPVSSSIPEINPLYDEVSNALSLRLSGDTGNPKLCAKTFTITGGCETTGYCSTGITYTTGTSVTEWCSTRGIFDDCLLTDYSDYERWVQIDAVFERNTYLDKCDLEFKGGTGQIIFDVYEATLQNNSVSLIEPPTTHENPYNPPKVEIVNMNETWIEEKNFRLGKLKFFVNGKIFMVIENFEEIIPRPLNTSKETQIGVAYNISLGGGTQGLHDNLTVSGCADSISGITYQQDPECLPTEVLNKTSYEGLSTEIHLEEYFGGSFIGDISAFRMYTEPLNASQIRHNFKLLKEKYNLLDPFCLKCDLVPSSFDSCKLYLTTENDEDILTQNTEFILAEQDNCSTTPTPTPTPTPTSTISLIPPTNDFTYKIIPNNDLYYEILEPIPPTPTPTPTPTSITPTPTPTSITPTPTPTNTLTPTITETLTPTTTVTETPTETPTNTPTSTIPLTCDSITLSGDNVTTTTNSVVKTSEGGWNASAYSLETYSNAVSLTFQISGSGYLMGGFSYNPTNYSETYQNISYGFYIQPAFLEIYENGNQVTVPGSMVNTDSDVWKVDYNGMDVKYYKNNILLYTSLNSVIQPLHIFFSILTNGFGVTNVCAIGVQPTPTPTITNTETPTPTITESETPTPTPTITETPAETPTQTPTMYYYDVNGYSCGTPCSLVGTYTVMSPTPLTIGYFYNNPENRGYTFEILSLIPAVGGAYDLTGEPGYVDCVMACYPSSPTPTPTYTETPTPTPTSTSIVLINPLLISVDEYLIVGDNQYLEY